MKLFFLLLPLWVAVPSTAQAPPPKITFDCSDGCLARENYSVKAFVHGSSNDPFYQEIAVAARQTANDMGITNFDLVLYDDYDTVQMASDINEYVATSPQRSGILVSIPDDTVATAVKGAIDARIPVVGINSGVSYGDELGVLDFVAPNDVKGGSLAAETLIGLQGNVTSVLFINEQDGNKAHLDRLVGLKKVLQDAAVEDLNVFVFGDDNEAELNSKLVGCPYQAIILSGPLSLSDTISAYETNGCTLEGTSLGAFETSDEVFDALNNDQLDFTIGNNQYLQGSLATVLTVLAISKGKSLAGGAYDTGPRLITKTNIPIGDMPERSTVKIGGVTHGITSDSFWDPVYAASDQAANDMNIELLNERFDASGNVGDEALHNRMATRIEELCTEGDITGIFVSIPSDIINASIQKCLDMNIPVVSINAGAETSEEMGLAHHIGMLEFNAGKAAGLELIEHHVVEEVRINTGVCVNHAEGVSTIDQRCKGFAAALEEYGLNYLGQALVPTDNEAVFIENIEAVVNQTGDWNGVGILITGPPHSPAINLQQRHPKSRIGVFDLSPEVFQAIDDGVFRFGVDQEPWLQGYMPVVLLTYIATMGQGVSNQVIESGPAFTLYSPSQDELACEEIHFKSCSEEDIAEIDSNDDEESNDIGEETGQQPTEQTQSSATGIGGAVSVFLVLFSSIANFI